MHYYVHPFQILSGTWYNIGDDRMQNGEIIGEQAEVISDLRLHDYITFRDLTKYLLDKITIYQERIKPVIIGKLLSEKAADIETVYLGLAEKGRKGNSLWIVRA
jgi:hypothetical protein